MASAKRARAPDPHDTNDNRHHQSKRHRPNLPVFNSAMYSNNDHDTTRAHNGHDKPNHRSMYSQQRGYARPASPQLSTQDMQTGLVALLDRFIAAETTSDADRDVLHHAHQLRSLVCVRNNIVSAKAKHELDEKRPNTVARVVVPDYLERRISEASRLPPLPLIAEPHLHEAVFTHRSANIDPTNPQHVNLDLDYERLELLGDAYIELIASRALYSRFPHVDVPELCSWRERLVENSALGKFSEAYGLPDRLKHRAHWDHDAKAWRKVVADIFEAYVSAIILSDPVHGFNTAEEWLTELWAPQLLAFKEKIVENPQAKDELNRLLTVKDIKLDYRQEKPMTYDSGSIQRFYIGVYLTGWGYQDEWLGSGEGQNKHQAAIAAATAAIKNSPAVKDAARQKAELMEIRREAMEDAKAKEEADADTSGPPPATSDIDNPVASKNNGSHASEIQDNPKKRKGGKGATSPDNKRKKKHKEEEGKKEKEKKDKQHKKAKSSSDNESP